MLERFLKLPPNHKYLGFFGTNHTRLNESKKLAGMLNEQPKFSGNVLTINMHHQNSFYAQNQPINYSFLNDVGFFRKRYIKEYISYFDSLSNCDSFISKINATTKGFKKLQEMCDYVIIIRNQMGYSKIDEK